VDAREARAEVRAFARNWDGAGADFLKTLSGEGQMLERPWWAGRLALFVGGDPEPLRKACRDRLPDFDNGEPTPEALQAIRFSCAVPGVVSDYKPLAAGTRKRWEHLAETPEERDAAALAGMASYRAGRFADALKALERSYKLEPNNPEVLPFLALARHKTGDQPGAAEALKKLTEYLAAEPTLDAWFHLEPLRAEAAVLLAEKK
jgi:tetratricopeptide (TPR) repeat protein